MEYSCKLGAAEKLRAACLVVGEHDMGAQLQLRCLSPKVLSMRPTEGQNFESRSHGRGHAACWRV